MTLDLRYVTRGRVGHNVKERPTPPSQFVRMGTLIGGDTVCVCVTIFRGFILCFGFFFVLVKVGIIWTSGNIITLWMFLGVFYWYLFRGGR